MVKKTSKTVELENQILELTASLKRTAADFANYRQRAEAEKQQSSTLAQAALVTRLFPILDNFRRSAEHAPDLSNLPVEEQKRFGSYLTGLQQIEKQLEQILTAAGLERIAAVGQPFDLRTMEAVAYEPHTDLAQDTVIDEIESGWRLGDQVLRPAKVRVSQG